MANVQRERPNRPPPRGLIQLAVATGSSSAVLLEKVHPAWAVVAARGRWCDEELGDRIETPAALTALPDWLRAASTPLIAPAKPRSWFPT